MEAGGACSQHPGPRRRALPGARRSAAASRAEEPVAGERASGGPVPALPRWSSDSGWACASPRTFSRVSLSPPRSLSPQARRPPPSSRLRNYPPSAAQPAGRSRRAPPPARAGLSARPPPASPPGSPRCVTTRERHGPGPHPRTPGQDLGGRTAGRARPLGWEGGGPHHTSGAGGRLATDFTGPKLWKAAGSRDGGGEGNQGGIFRRVPG